MKAAIPARLRQTFVSIVGLGLLPLQAQSELWHKQAPDPSGGHVAGMAVVSPTEVWAVGWQLYQEPGDFWHTRDFGETWEVNDFTGGSVNTIHFLDEMHGWAWGDRFYHTVDGGQSWIADTQFNGHGDLFFLDTQYGWACGPASIIYRTTDGGLNWTNTPPQTGGWGMRSIHFLNPNDGWVVSHGGYVFQSSDGGETWDLNSTWGELSNLNFVKFFDPLEGRVSGGNTFLHTIDGGQTWMPQNVPPGTWSYGAAFYDRLNGIAVGEYGNIIRTTDGGATWTTIRPVGSGQRLWRVEYADADTVFCSGDSGTVLGSTDGGASWTPIQDGAAGITRAIVSLDADTAWTANDGGEIAFTEDGGEHWTRQVVGGFDVFGRILDVGFSDELHGWATGWNEAFAERWGRVSRTTDGGRTWSRKLNVKWYEFRAVAPTSPEHAYVMGIPNIGGPALVLRTANGGDQWVDVTPPSPGSLWDVYFISPSVGWLVGTKIMKTTNAGGTWTTQHDTNGGPLIRSVAFADAMTGWAVGFKNILLHTTDGGQTWTPQNSGAGPDVGLMGVEALSPTTAWITGWYGFAARTTDGGDTWQPVVLPGSQNGEHPAHWEGLSFIDEGTGWIVGNKGIWKRERECDAPTSYCTAKSGLACGTPSIQFLGKPSASESNGFFVFADPARGNQSGLLLYTDSGRAAQPFQGGFLCVSPLNLRRTPPVTTGGTQGSCDGEFLIDLNAFASGTSGGNPAPFLQLPGTVVDCQWWGRDTIPTGSFLSDGLEYSVCP